MGPSILAEHHFESRQPMKSSDQDFRVGKLIRPKNPKSWEKAMTDKRLQEILS